MQIELDTKNDNPVLVFRNRHSDRYYVHGPLESCDVAPGPVKLSGFNDDEGDGKFFLFWIADCAFPPMHVIRHRTFGDAYEAFVDWQTEQLKSENEDDAERLEFLKGYNYNSNGVPVDTEGVHGEEVFFVAAIQWPGDRNLWNLACMFLIRVTRYENSYDDEAKFRRAMAKCCSSPGVENPHLTENAVQAWKAARALSNYTF